MAPSHISLLRAAISDGHGMSPPALPPSLGVSRCVAPQAPRTPAAPATPAWLAQCLAWYVLSPNARALRTMHPGQTRYEFEWAGNRAGAIGPRTEAVSLGWVSPEGTSAQTGFRILLRCQRRPRRGEPAAAAHGRLCSQTGSGPPRPRGSSQSGQVRRRAKMSRIAAGEAGREAGAAGGVAIDEPCRTLASPSTDPQHKTPEAAVMTSHILEERQVRVTSPSMHDQL